MQCLCEQGGPLPDISGAPSQFHAITHAHINDRSRLLSGDSTGGLAPYAYWSSTEDGAGYARYQVLADGRQNFTSKAKTLSIRPVRAF